jgi:hypothetical protein
MDKDQVKEIVDEMLSTGEVEVIAAEAGNHRGVRVVRLVKKESATVNE